MMNSCSVKHYILAIDDNNQDDASYTAQIDDGEKIIGCKHRFMHAGAAQARGGQIVRMPLLLVMITESSSVTHHIFINMIVYDDVMRYRDKIGYLDQKNWYPDHLDPSSWVSHQVHGNGEYAVSTPHLRRFELYNLFQPRYYHGWGVFSAL